ncbi:MAG: hypothetical protein ACK4YP_14685 [Myxococcota bacterium]
MAERKREGSGAEPGPVEAPVPVDTRVSPARAAAGAGPEASGEQRKVPPQGIDGTSGVEAAAGRVESDARAADGNTVVPPEDARTLHPSPPGTRRPASTNDPTAPHTTAAIRDPAQTRDPEAARAGGGRSAIGPEDRRPVTGASAEDVTDVPEEPTLLGKPPQAHEGQRPSIGESSSQAWPGAFSEHGNPIAGEDRPSVGGQAAANALPSGSRATTRPSASDDAASGIGGTRGSGSYGEQPAGKVVLAPGEALPPRPAPDMTATGAAQGKNPEPPFAGGERRVAQLDWDRWRAKDRRRAPFQYPEWRS